MPHYTWSDGGARARPSAYILRGPTDGRGRTRWNNDASHPHDRRSHSAPFDSHLAQQVRPSAVSAPSHASRVVHACCVLMSSVCRAASRGRRTKSF